MEDEKIKVKVSTILAIIEFIIILVLTIGICYLISTNKLHIIKTSDKEQENIKINGMEETIKLPLTYDEIGKREFEKLLESFIKEKDDYRRIVSYKINSCKMIYYYEEEFVCAISYDIEVPNIKNSVWAAGNGERNENYIANKIGFVEFIKQNGEYICNEEGPNISTGWSLPTEEIEHDIQENNVPDKDLYAQGNEFFVFIENGTAYYKYSKEYSNFESDISLKNIDKFEEQVKRVKIFNLGTDITDYVFLILEDGTVKMVSRNNDLEVFELLKDYKVEDIVSVEGSYYPGNEVKYKLLLKDGTSKEVIDVVDIIE